MRAVYQAVCCTIFFRSSCDDFWWLYGKNLLLTCMQLLLLDAPDVNTCRFLITLSENHQWSPWKDGLVILQWKIGMKSLLVLKWWFQNRPKVLKNCNKNCATNHLSCIYSLCKSYMISIIIKWSHHVSLVPCTHRGSWQQGKGSSCCVTQNHLLNMTCSWSITALSLEWKIKRSGKRA